MYTPLYIKTDYSLLNSMIKIKELVKFAKKNNIKALTITDDNMFGVMEFYTECVENNIKPIIGLELLQFDRILYAKNEQGYKNLLKITTLYRDETLTIDKLKEYNSDLICIVPFSNKDNLDDYSYYENVFVSFSNKEEEKQLGNNKIYISPILYLEKEDGKYYDYLKALKNGTGLNISEEYNNYFKLEKDLDYDLTNNYKIYELCDIKISKNKNLIPKYDCPNGKDSYTYLKELCIEGLKDRFGETVSLKYKERLKYELDVIHKMGFDDYFLIVYDYVKYAKENNILVGPGRGSAAGSLVSYVLKIIEVDPLKYGLLFERFLNEKRVTLPDIDVDFDGDKKIEVINYCIKKYGVKKVSGIITFIPFGPKQVIKDIARVVNYDMEDIDFLCNMITSKLTLKENYDMYPKIKNELKNNEELNNIYNIALHLEGLKKTTSVHASGIVMCNDDIDSYVPLEKHDDMYLTGYDMNYLESLGLLKMDFLSLKTLSVIQNILDDIKDDIDLNNIPLDDEKTIEVFKKANTLGIFQFESDGMIQMLKKFKPNNFEEIYNILALYRPGPMQNIDSFIRRKNKYEKVNYFHPNLIPILKSTYGILVYQEQIMQVANVMAGYTLGEADILRRAMSKKKEDILLKEKDKFVTKSIQNGYDSSLANNIYDLILKFAEYGFNKSHSVAYAVISFKMAYLKAHYPSHFMKNLLSSVAGSDKNVKEYIYECRNENTKILNPDINKSFKNYVVEEDGVRYPFSGIKGIGVVAIDTILKEREKGLFKDIYDFLIRVDKRIINRKIISNLIDSGCLDSFDLNRKTLTENIDIILNYADLVNELGEEYALKPELIVYEEYSKKEIIKKEYEVFGFYLNNHPVNDYRKKYNKPLSTSNISSYQDKFVDLIVFVDRVKDFTNKKNERMCFITVSDSYSSLQVVVFSKTYSSMPKIKENDIILLTGRVERRNGKDQIVANKIKLLDE